MLNIVRSRTACYLETARLSSWVDPCLLSVIQQANQQNRGMAKGRNHFLKGASSKQDISDETKDLLKNARNPEDKSWKLGHGIQEPLVMDPTTPERKRATQYIVKYRGENINDGDDLVKYYPHAGEEIPTINPSPVLMVKRVKDFRGETWFNKDFCEQIGLGNKEKLSKFVFLPNIPSVSSMLFKIKHIIEIKPITFPNGIPDDFDPDKHGYKLKSNGEFVVHPSLKVDLKEMTKDADWMKLSSEDISREGRKHWKAPYTSVLGDSHYHKDTRWRDNSKADSQYVKNQRTKWSQK